MIATYLASASRLQETSSFKALLVDPITQHAWRFSISDGAQTSDVVLEAGVAIFIGPGVIFDREGNNLELFVANEDARQFSLQSRDNRGALRWVKTFAEGELIQFAFATNGDVVVEHGRANDPQPAPTVLERLDSMTDETLKETSICGFCELAGGDEFGAVMFGVGRQERKVRRFDF